MERIASFCVDHTRLERGMYISRVDGDVVTYDIRMKKPNQGDYLANGALHTIEHLFATYARNSVYGPGVIYVGPMGCRHRVLSAHPRACPTQTPSGWCRTAFALWRIMRAISPAPPKLNAAITVSRTCPERTGKRGPCSRF